MTKWNTYQLIKSYSCYKCPLVLTVNSASGNTGPVRPNIDLGDLFCSKSHGRFLYKHPLWFLSGVSFLSHKHTTLSYLFFLIGNKQTLGKITHEPGYQNICSYWRWQSSIIRCQWDSPKVTPSFFLISLHWYWDFIQCCSCNSIPQYSHLGESADMIILHRLRNPNTVGLLSGTFTSSGHRCSNERTSKLPDLQTLPTTWKWSWIFLMMDWPTVQVPSWELSQRTQQCYVNQ